MGRLARRAVRRTRRRVRLSNRPTKIELDALWSEAVKVRAGYKSEHSGKCKYAGHVLNSHHINGKPNYTLRWDLSNGVCITNGEHRFIAHHAGRCAKFRHWAMVLRGVTEEEAEFKSRGGSKVDTFVMKAYLKAKVAEFSEYQRGLKS